MSNNRRHHVFSGNALERIKRQWGHAVRKYKFRGVGPPRFPRWDEVEDFVKTYGSAFTALKQKLKYQS